MITLAPISEKIQDTLNKKIAMLKSGAGGNQIYKNGEGKWEAGKTAIGTTVSENGSTVENYMFSRSPWLRMISFTPKNFKEMKEKDPLEAVIIMGGELSILGKLRSGFSGLYNPKESGYKIPYRPIAGIKDISVEYKGGGMTLGATRSGEINWTCWSHEEIDRLTPHFLKDGKTVLLEWGWTGIGDLKKDMFIGSLFDPDKDVPTFKSNLGLEKNETLNQKILKHIQEKGGHYDAMLGLVTSFTWSLRDDGGFDCTTSLIAPGVSMLQKTVQKTSRKKTFSRLPSIGLDSIVNDIEKPVKGDEEEDVAFEKREKEYEAKVKAAEELHLDKIKKMGLPALAPYISFREYMSDFHNQLIGNAKEMLTNNKNIFFTSEVKNVSKWTAVEWDVKTEKDSPTQVAMKRYILGKSGDGSNIFVTWGWFEDNVLSRFFGSVVYGSETPDSVPEKLIGEFRSIEQAVDNNGKYRFYDNDPARPIMQSNRFINSPYIITINASKWIIVGAKDPILDNTQWYVLRKDIKVTDSVTEHEPFLEKSQLKGYFYKENADNTPEDINKNTKEHLVIRNILFNAKYLSDIFKDRLDLLGAVTSVWNAFSNEYGGVYRFKVDYDDGGHRLFIKEQGYTDPRFSVAKYMENKTAREEGTLKTGEPSLFVFPVWEAGSIVKSNNISAKLPNRMKLAAMYSGLKLKDKGGKEEFPEIDNPYDDLIGKAWGRLSQDKTKNLKEKKDSVKLQDIRASNLKDLISGDVSFPSRGNLPFGRRDADVQQELLPSEVTVGTRIHESIFDEIAESAKEELMSRKHRWDSEAKSSKKTDDDKTAEELQLNFQSYVVGQASLSTWDEYYEWIWDKDSMHSIAKMPVGYPKIKSEIAYRINKSLRKKRDGVFARVEPIIPIDFDMEIDGTGGLYPGNSFHSSYLSETYKKRCLFQMVKIGHRIDSSGWKTTIKGQIRAVPIENKSGVSLTLGTSGNETTKNNQSGEESNNPTGAGISQEDPYTNMNSEQANNLAKNNGKTSFYWQKSDGDVVNWATWT